MRAVSTFTPIAPAQQDIVLLSCQEMIRKWIIAEHGQPDDPESVEWWTRNISFWSRERMADEGAMGDGVGVASEGIFGWTNWCASELGVYWHERGIFLEPYNGWCLAVYLRQQ